MRIEVNLRIVGDDDKILTDHAGCVANFLEGKRQLSAGFQVAIASNCSLRAGAGLKAKRPCRLRII